MVKRTMYFYDKKQADLIKKVNDKLHRQRGVRVKDDDNTNKKISIMQNVVNEIINIERRFSKQWTSEERKIYNKAREGANNIIQYIKSKGKTPDLLAPSINYSELKNITGAETHLNNIKKLLRELKDMPIHNKVNDKLHRQRGVKVGDAPDMLNDAFRNKLIGSLKKDISNFPEYTKLIRIVIRIVENAASIATVANEIKDLARRVGNASLKKEYLYIAQNIAKLNSKFSSKITDAPDTKIIVNILHKAAQEAAQQYNDNKGMGFAPAYKMLANKLIEFKNIVERMGTQYLKEEQLINAISSIKDTSAPKEFNILKNGIINQLKKAFK